MSKRGPTREMLQPQCQIPPVQNSKLLHWYFNGARQLLLQGDGYFDEGELLTAYVYYKRFLYLALGILTHSAYENKTYGKDRAWLHKERERIFPRLEAISAQLDDADDRAIRAAAATRAAAAAAAAASAGMVAAPAATGWWDNLPEAPTGNPPSHYGGSSMPPPLPPPLAGVVPSAPPANACYGWEGPGYGSLPPPAGVTGGVGGGLALQDAFSALSMDQTAPASGPQYPIVGAPEYQADRPSMRPDSRHTSVFGVKRRLVLPSTLIAEFEKIAKPNTDRPPYGIETCGILAGKLAHNVLEMTTLIIPKQEGTSDSCATTDETELFNYMLANKLITLGWVHTHPKQECFMSSVDVHTHCGYQLMLPEAVAVVYAPCDNTKRVGVFRLTEPEGMKLIQECKLKGFHVHPDGVTIYENADLMWAPVHMNLVDLR